MESTEKEMLKIQEIVDQHYLDKEDTRRLLLDMYFHSEDMRKSSQKFKAKAKAQDQEYWRISLLLHQETSKVLWEVITKLQLEEPTAIEADDWYRRNK